MFMYAYKYHNNIWNALAKEKYENFMYFVITFMYQIPIFETQKDIYPFEKWQKSWLKYFLLLGKKCNF